MENELADLIQVVTLTEEGKIDFGLAFFDRTPEGAVAEFVGTPPEGVYYTDKESIVPYTGTEKASNGVEIENYMGGSRKVTTIIVQKETMDNIVNGILNSDDPSRIVIDTNQIIKTDNIETIGKGVK